MAQRPVFLPASVPERLVEVKVIDFQWHAGLSRQQKQKSILSLHEAAREQLGLTALLEISSKSLQPLGDALSAFHLTLEHEGAQLPVEVVFQAAKVFAGGGPYLDLLGKTSREAKQDERLRSSGPLRGFSYLGRDWPLKPETAFYDWLYLRALRQHGYDLSDWEGFTDIEFNPKRSLNCQARSAALYVSLCRRQRLELLDRPEDFLSSLEQADYFFASHAG